MTALRLALTELRRISANTVGRVALVAMVLVPSIYGGLYLYANNDPYANLDQVPAALVVEDTGTTLSTGEELAVGEDVAASILEAATFDWSRVDRAEAEKGLDDGDFDLALLVPADFSADLASTAGSDPRQATLVIDTNDANNYLARTIANTLVTQVTASVAEQVSSTAASRYLEGFATIHAQVDDAAAGAQSLAEGATKAASGAHRLASGSADLLDGQEKLVDGSAQLSSGAKDLSSGLATLRSGTADLPEQTADLSEGSRRVADGNARVADAGREVAEAADALVVDLTSAKGELADQLVEAGFTQEQIDLVLAKADVVAGRVDGANAKVQEASGQLDDLSDGAAQVADGAEALAKAAGPLTSGIDSAADGGTDLADGASTLASGQRDALDGAELLAAGAKSLDSGLGTIASGASTLADGLEDGASSIPDPSPEQRQAAAETIGSPVTVQRNAEAAAATYGAGLAPFFMTLALWIGGFVLFTRMRALSSRALSAGQPGWRVSLGGWLAPALLGVAQVATAFAVVSLAVGIDVARPVALLGFMVLVSLTFIAVIHTLMARFGLVGQFMALVLMVLQLVTAGGTFPWQTLPGPLQPLHHVLPMSYAVDGVRRLMYGGPLGPLTLDLLVIATWGVGALALGALAARRAGTWTPARVKPELVA